MASLLKYCLVSVYFVIHCYSSNALPTSPFLCHFASLEDCIRSYWSVGYKYTSIVTFLATYHGIQISLRQLKYLINVKYNLRRRRRQSTANEIRRAMCYELNGPGCLLGYRSMKRCNAMLGRKRFGRHLENCSVEKILFQNTGDLLYFETFYLCESITSVVLRLLEKSTKLGLP